MVRGKEKRTIAHAFSFYEAARLLVASSTSSPLRRSPPLLRCAARPYVCILRGAAGLPSDVAAHATLTSEGLLDLSWLRRALESKTLRLLVFLFGLYVSLNSFRQVLFCR